MFDRAVCINLDKRPDRWRRFLGQVPRDWPFGPIERVAAVDGERVTPPEWYRPAPQNVGDGVTVVERSANPQEALRGAWGCLRSHVRIWEDTLGMLKPWVDSVLVLEDDAVFCDGFSEKATAFLAEVPDDWDQIYFGGQHLEIPEGISPLVVRGCSVNRTHAYAIRGRMMLAAYHEMCGAPTSCRQQQAHIDHRFGLMHRTGSWRIYAPRRWLVGQAAGQSDVVSPGRNATREEWWHSKMVKNAAGCA